jgi:hypothetical protein
MQKDRPKRPSRVQAILAQDQIQGVTNSLERKEPVLFEIQEAIRDLERKLVNLRHLEKSYLDAALATVENTRADLEALLAD